MLDLVRQYEAWSTYMVYVSHMLHIWYIYLHNWVIFRANVGKYSIHGVCGYGSEPTWDFYGIWMGGLFAHGLMGISPYDDVAASEMGWIESLSLHSQMLHGAGIYIYIIPPPLKMKSSGGRT